jgi:hypothetical protein
MKKISTKAIIASALFVSCGLIAGLATAAGSPGHRAFGHYGKINALKLDSNQDGALSQEELLSHNTTRFTRLDSNEDGSISKDEFNARLIAMFEAMDSNSDGMLKGDEMPKRHHGGHGRHDYGRNHG